MISDDVILEQMEFSYDAAGSVVETVIRRRYHNAPDNQTGPLEDPSTTPKARVTYIVSYPDALGRIIATADSHRAIRSVARNCRLERRDPRSC